MNQSQFLPKQRLDLEFYANQDSVGYFKACRNSGFEPEFLDLYELGALESAVEERGLTSLILKSSRDKITGSKQKKVPNHILKFLRGGKDLNLNNFTDEADYKRGALSRSFAKFRKDGPQDIFEYDAGDVGKIYKRLYDNYLNKYGPQ